MNIKLLFGAMLMLIVLVFSMQNAGVVDVRFLGWNFVTSLALVIFTAMALGAVGGWALTGALRLRNRNRSKESRPD